jgi:hypothetical protein
LHDRQRILLVSFVGIEIDLNYAIFHVPNPRVYLISLSSLTSIPTRMPQVLQMLRIARKPDVGVTELWNGVPIPWVGFGTGAMVREEVRGFNIYYVMFIYINIYK